MASIYAVKCVMGNKNPLKRLTTATSDKITNQPTERRRKQTTTVVNAGTSNTALKIDVQNNLCVQEYLSHFQRKL